MKAPSLFGVLVDVESLILKANLHLLPLLRFQLSICHRTSKLQQFVT